MKLEFMRSIASLALDGLKSAGAEKAECRIELESKDESNALGHREYLTRCYDNYTVTLKCAIGKRWACVRTNRIDGASMLSAANRCADMARLADENEAMAAIKAPPELTRSNDAPAQPAPERDSNKLYARFVEFLNAEQREFPEVYLDTSAQYSQTDIYYANTEGESGSITRYDLGFGVDCAARTADKVSGCGHVFKTGLDDIDTPFMDMPGVREDLGAMMDRLDAHTLDPDITIESVIFKPVWNFIYMEDVLRILREERGVKPGDRVFNKDLSMYCEHSAEPFTDGENPGTKRSYTVRDGLLAPDTEGDEGDPAYPYSRLVFAGGSGSYGDFIKGIRTGVLVDYVAGAGIDRYGNFSGVIKNGRLIENGEVKYPLCSVMISGNIADMFSRGIQSVSGETSGEEGLNFPWIALGGATVR